MAHEKAPAFQFYPKDYLSDMNVQALTIEQEGCYIRLLSYCWLEGHIPNDLAILSRLCKGANTEAIQQVVAICFVRDEKHPEWLVHPRLDEERVKQAEWAAKSAEGGRRTQSQRVTAIDNHSSTTLEPPLNHRSTTLEPPLQPFVNSSSSSAIASINPPLVPPLQKSQVGERPARVSRERHRAPPRRDRVAAMRAMLDENGEVRCASG